MFYIYANGKSIYQPSDQKLLLFAPKLTLEMGKAGSLSFQMAPTHRYYNSLNPLSTTITVEIDDVEIFRGRVLNNSRNFNRMRTVYCEGMLAYLVDSVQKAEKYDGTAYDLFRRIIDGHNSRVNVEKQFTVGEITIEDRSVILTGKSDNTEDSDTGEIDYKQIALNSVADEWQTSFDFIETCLLDYTGGYLRTRYEDGINYIDLLADYGTTAVQEIEFGKNLLDLTEETAVDDVFTVLIPLGDKNLTIETVNGGSDELVDETAVEKYGRIVKTHVFDSVTDPNTLLENAQRYLQNYTNETVTITAKAVDMHLVDPNVTAIYVGDKVKIDSLPHEMSDTLTCTKIEYDLENPANNAYTFGSAKQSLTERYRKDKTKSASSGSRGGGSSGGSGGASEAAAEESEEALKEFYKAWINVDSSAGTIDLGTLYEKYQDSVTILKNECGIDVTSSEERGNINLSTIRDQTESNTKAIIDQAATINMLSDSTGSQIELVTAYAKALEEQEQEHYAALVVRADNLESRINLKADKVTIDSDITTINGRITTINSTITEVKQLIADEIESVKVDTTWLETSIGNIGVLKAAQINTATLYAARQIYVMRDGVYSVVATKNDISALTGNYATESWVEGKGYLTSIPDNLTVSKIKATDGMSIGVEKVATQHWCINEKKYATQDWVTEQLKGYAASGHTHTYASITNKPSAFKPASHTHSFSGSTSISTGHTHTVKVNGTSYTTNGASKYKFDVKISGTTGSN